jgi:hypothetical protein
MSSELIRAKLRSETAAYQPDRSAILTRLRHGQATLDSPRVRRAARRRTVVTAAMAATVATVLGFGVAVTWAAVRSEAPPPPPRAASPTVAATGPAPVVASKTASATGPVIGPRHDRTSHPPSAAQTTPAPTASPTATAILLSAGGAVDPHSIDNWAQSNVTLRNSATMTTFELRVRIALTPQTASTGAWSTIAADDLTTRVEQQPDALVYTFTLKPGVRLAPATHLFGVQYSHAPGGRDPKQDTYQAFGTTADDTRVEVSGGF